MAVTLPDFTPHRPPIDPISWEGEVDYYSQGSCHILALAAADLWPESFSHFLVVTNPHEVSWQNPDDPDDALPFVVHVYAVFLSPDGEIALDIFGLRPAHRACEESGERYSVGCDAESESLNRDLLISAYVERDDPEDPARWFRPLHEVQETDLDAARTLLNTLLPDGPFWIRTGQHPHARKISAASAG